MELPRRALEQWDSDIGRQRVGQGEKEDKHELSKGGNAGKTLARSMSLTGARALSTGTGEWWKRRKPLDFVHWHYLRMCIISLCTWEHTTGDILHMQESGQLTPVCNTVTCFLCWQKQGWYLDFGRAPRKWTHGQQFQNGWRCGTEIILRPNKCSKYLVLLKQQDCYASKGTSNKVRGQVQFVQWLCVR